MHLVPREVSFLIASATVTSIQLIRSKSLTNSSSRKSDYSPNDDLPGVSGLTILRLQYGLCCLLMRIRIILTRHYTQALIANTLQEV